MCRVYRHILVNKYLGVWPIWNILYNCSDIKVVDIQRHKKYREECSKKNRQ